MPVVCPWAQIMQRLDSLRPFRAAHTFQRESCYWHQSLQDLFAQEGLEKNAAKTKYKGAHTASLKGFTKKSATANNEEETTHCLATTFRSEFKT